MKRFSVRIALVATAIVLATGSAWAETPRGDGFREQENQMRVLIQQGVTEKRIGPSEGNGALAQLRDIESQEAYWRKRNGGTLTPDDRQHVRDRLTDLERNVLRMRSVGLRAQQSETR